MDEVREIERIIERIVNLIRRGYSRGKILSEMVEDTSIFSREKLFEMARCRMRSREKFGELGERLFLDEESLRYSTPPLIADYRARRLEGDIIADISCGAGIQAIYFAMRSGKVIAVERDPVKLELAKLNARLLNIENMEFIQGDALSREVYGRIKADIVFSDPSRKPEERIRTMDGLEPPPLKVYDIYRKVTDKIAFELPPQIRKENVLIDGEREYTSLDFKLNRLALYTGPLKRCDVSAISLPREERVTSNDPRRKVGLAEQPLDYLYEVDPTIVKADLLENLAGKIDFDGFLLMMGKRRTLLTSSEWFESSFLRGYHFLTSCKFSVEEIRKELLDVDAGKVMLRFSIDPKDYWRFRKRLEEGLSGSKKVELFRVGERAILAERVNS